MSFFWPTSKKERIAGINAATELYKADQELAGRLAHAQSIKDAQSIQAQADMTKASIEDSLKRSAMKAAGREAAGAELGSMYSYGGAEGLKPEKPVGGWTSPVQMIRGTDVSWGGGPMQEFNSPIRAQQNINRMAGVGEYIPEDKPGTWQLDVDTKGNPRGFVSSASPKYVSYKGLGLGQERTVSPGISVQNEAARLFDNRGIQEDIASPKGIESTSSFYDPEDSIYDNPLARLHRWLSRITRGTEPTEVGELR